MGSASLCLDRTSSPPAQTMNPRLGLTALLLLAAAVAACSEGSDTLTPEERRPSDQANGGAGGEPALPDSVPIHPSTDGWLDASDNAIGMQGQWSNDPSSNSTVEVTITRTEICAEGSAAQIVDGQWVEYWGAFIAFQVCATGPDGDPPDTTYTLGTCPWAPDLDDQVYGIRFQLTGTLPEGLSITFRERDRDWSPQLDVLEEGEVIALFEDAYSWDGEPPNPSNIESIEFRMRGSQSAPGHFDFCISELEAITSDDWVSYEVPDWALEPGLGLRVELAGVNLAGAEFGQDSLPGVLNQDYIYPSDQEVDWTVNQGMNLIRLPFLWERLQPTLEGELDPEQLGYLDAFVGYATDAGVAVIIDPHNFARYREQVVGEDIAASTLADFWGRVAAHYSDGDWDSDLVLFGLMNEPHDMQTEAWVAAANAAIQAIRDTGADNLLLVPGNGWTGAHNWTDDYYGTSNGEAMLEIVDPADHFVFEVHQYLDSDSSGRGSACVSETIGSERLEEFTDWARSLGYRALLGEFGAPASETCLHALDDMLGYVGDNADVFMGWAYWAAGPWWGTDRLAIEPVRGEDRPQTYILRRHL